MGGAVVAGFDSRSGGVDTYRRQQRSLHLAQLDAEATQLDLRIATAEILDTPGTGNGDVTGPIHSIARRAEGVGHEPGRIELEPTQIASGDLWTRDIELTGYTVGNRRQATVEDVGPCPRDRATDIGCRCGADEVDRQLTARHVDRGLGGAVHVVQLRPRVAFTVQAICMPASNLLEIERLAHEDHAAHRGRHTRAGRWAHGRSELIKGRRRQIDDRHLLAVKNLHEIRRGTGGFVVEDHQSAAEGQRHPDLPDRHVERVRLEHRPHIVLGVVIHPRHGIEERHNVLMGDRDAFRLSGRPRRVHDVGGVRRIDTRRQCRRPRRDVEEVVDCGHHVAERRGRPRMRRFGIGDDDRRRGVVDDRGQPLDRMRTVERQVGRPRPRDGYQDHDQFSRPRKRNSHQCFRAGSTVDKAKRDVV